MPIVRMEHNKDNPYLIANKSPLESTELSWEAKGLWTYLISRPDNWQISISHLSSIYKKKGGGAKAIYNILNELIEHGYCSRLPSKRINGKFQKIEYVIYEFKNKVPHSPVRHAVQPRTVKAPPTNNDIKNNDTTYVCKNNDIKNNKEKKEPITQESSFSCGNPNTVSSLAFSPKNYIMRNRLKFSFATAKLFEKYYDTPGSREKLLRNIQYYEEYCDKGGNPSNHEAYIQACFKNDYAGKADLSLQNHLYAEFLKMNHNIHNMKILKTVVQFHKDGEIQPISISKELPHASFCATIENFKRYHCQ